MTILEERKDEMAAGAARARAPRATLLLDTDTHPMYLAKDILPRLAEPWRSRMERTGTRGDRGTGGFAAYPRLRNSGYRLDTAVEGGFPGSDMGLMRSQHLDHYDVDFAILIPLFMGMSGAPDFQAAMARAINEWIAEEWLDEEPRFRATLQLPFEYPDLAVAEIERWRGDPRFVQILLSGGAHSEWGDRKYWPIYEACQDAGLVLMTHVGGTNNAYRGAGPPSFYLEQHLWLHSTTERIATSLICEGVFERFPGLQLALIEGCVSWAGPLQWAMDALFEQLHDDLPALRAKPSEYFREHCWFSTQPVEEPDHPRHLVQAYEFTGMVDHIMFSSDYPHWDFDDPTRAFPGVMPREMRNKIMGENACRLYGLTPTRPATAHR